MDILSDLGEEEDRDPEVMNYPYCFDLQMSFTDHELDTADMEYNLQPNFAQLLSFQLDVETAYHEKKKVSRASQKCYHYCHKNPKCNASILYGEPGRPPTAMQTPSSPGRSMHA